MNDAAWLAGVKRLRAIAQTGLTYSQDPYDLERYRELQILAERMLASLANVPVPQIHDLFLEEKGYPTPKVDVRAGVFRGDEVLLVRERSDGRWSLPGGWADEHQSATGCVEREVMEESGFEVRVQRLVAIKDRHLHPYQPPSVHRVYKLFFLCELVGGAPQGSIETSAAEFFPVTDLPPLSLGRTLAADGEWLAARRPDAAVPCYLD